MAHRDTDILKDISPVMPTYGRAALSFVRGQGAWLETGDGARYLDFGSGIAVNALGHAHPHLVEILKTQAETLWHVSNLYEIPSQRRLAERLVAHSFADTVFFCNSGAEAMEACIKTARKYQSHTGHPQRYRIITFEGAFHGRTLAMIAAGGQEKHLAGFGPKVDGFDQVAVGDRAAVKAAITPATAGILIEPIQGEGGIRMIDTAFLRFLRDLCDENGLLLILDEVQTGIGRTGKLFAYEWSGIAPDIMGIAKGLGGGFPIGACLATAAAARGMTAGSHGSTFGGNPLATAVGNGVLDIVLADGFLAHVRHMGNRLAQGLSMLCDHYPDIVEDVRGQGLLAAVKCKVPNTELIEASRAQRLLTVGAGDNVVRLIPPLNVSAEEISEALTRLDAACAHVRETHRTKPEH